MKASLYTDGACRGNPGHSSAGLWTEDENGEIIFQEGFYLGQGTNNTAEWKSLILGMKRSLEEGVTDLCVYMDSDLVIKQISGVYKVKNEGLKLLFIQAQSLVRQFESISFHHIRREKNSRADMLANKALDEELKK